MAKLPHLHYIINQRLIRQGHACDSNCLITFINPFSYLKIRSISGDLVKFDKLGFDGISMCIIWKLLYKIDVERTSFDFTSFAKIVFDSLAETGKSIYIIGSRQDEIEKFIQKISNQYNRANILGYRNGYFDNSTDRLESLKMIASLNPDIVIAGLGTGRQEKFLIDLGKEGWGGCGFTCGGFIHQTAKSGVKYYPTYINKLHLRWMFRILNEPKLLKRYVFQYPLALVFIILDYFKFQSENFK